MSAKATFTPAKTETKTIEVEPAKVTLELTLDEARTLLRVTDFIGGDPTPGEPRSHTDSIRKSLHSAGLRGADVAAKGSLYFQ